MATEQNAQNEAQAAKRKVSVKIGDVLKMLQEGKDRKVIAAHYGMSQQQAKKLIFSHPALKNKKTHKEPDFDFAIEDDTAGLAVKTKAARPAPKAAAPVETATVTTPANPATPVAQPAAETASEPTAQGEW